MHYYQFNIADYRKHTGHLTLVEHYIYRWLIDEYHLSEHPFNNNMPKLLRRMSLDESHRSSLELILEEYFVPACDEDYKPDNLSDHSEYANVGDYPDLCQYWLHPRIDQDITDYKEFIQKKSVAGKASAKVRKDKLNTRSTGEQLTTNHKPLTNNHIKKKVNKEKIILPDYVNKDLWQQWLQIRIKKKAINSPIALKALLTILGAIQASGKYTADQAIQTAIEQSWKSVKLEWMENFYENNKSGNGKAKFDAGKYLTDQLINEANDTGSKG